MRPPNGIRFSKSAASLPISDASSMSDMSGNTTPTSGINKMRFQDFSVLSVIGQGSYGKVYHVAPKIQKLESDLNPTFESISTESVSSPQYN